MRETRAHGIYETNQRLNTTFLIAGNLYVCCLSHSGKSHSPEYQSSVTIYSEYHSSIPIHYADAMQAILKRVYIATAVFQRIK